MMIRLRTLLCFAAGMIIEQQSFAQKVNFSEYDLPNGLHVILHEDHNAPVVAVSVMYHVGSKNEVHGRTGFAHFFEHLLFEGTANIKRGDFMKIVAGNGGENNANTTQDRTFYYEVFPSNQIKLGLWLESERMFHPVINEIGVKTQNEVVKEEKRMRYDNQPYGNLIPAIFKQLFPSHPYHWTPIGYSEDLDSARLPEFQAFFKKYYAPNNAVLCIAGDFDRKVITGQIESYFGEIPKAEPVVYLKKNEIPIIKQLIDTAYDSNIQLPMITTTYRVPGMNSRDSKIMEMISTFLSGGGSSKLFKKMVDEKKEALEVGSFNYALEDYGAYITYAIPNNDSPLATLLKDIDEEVIKLQTTLISDDDYRKIQNKFENTYISANATNLGIAENLASGYTFYNKNTGHTNDELEIIRSITKDDLRNAAKKYLNPASRLILYYLPVSKR